MPKKPIRALLVDDDEEDLLILKRYLQALRSYNVEMRCLGTEAEAMEEIQRGNLDIIFLDLNLGQGRDGLQLLGELDALPVDVPTIMVTGSGDQEKAVSAMKAGAYDYLVKDDISPEVLERALRNVLERHRLEQEKARMVARLEELSVTDELTGLANRRRLEQRLAEETTRSARTGHLFAVLMIDMDGFKNVNDNYGHQVGDEMLRMCAQVLRENVRASDFVARYGGDEFCAILSDTTLAGGRTVAQRLRRAMSVLSDPMSTISVGVAAWSPGSSAEDVLRQADDALYIAKKQGRNCVIAHGEQASGRFSASESLV